MVTTITSIGPIMAVKTNEGNSDKINFQIFIGIHTDGSDWEIVYATHGSQRYNFCCCIFKFAHIKNNLLICKVKW